MSNIKHMSANDLAQRMGTEATNEQAEEMRAELVKAHYGYALTENVPLKVWDKCLARVAIGKKTAKAFKFREGKRNIPDGLTNGKRAEQAEFAVEAASRARGEAVTIDEDGIRDLLADLGHLCDRERLDFPGIVNTAKKDWRSER